MVDESVEKIAIEAVKQFSKPVISSVAKFSKSKYDKYKVVLTNCYEGYINRYYTRYSKTKTILYRDQPVDIKSYYVRTNLLVGEDVIDDVELIDYLDKNRRVVLNGTAGCGKSTYSKSLFLDIIEASSGKIPILIELRHLNTSDEESLYDFVYSTLSQIEPSLSREQLNYSIKYGKVCLILDGFDEIDHDLKELYEKEIIDLSVKYENLTVVVTSRPDERFSSWDEFVVANVLPLDKHKALLLVNKLEYDRVAKRKFLDELETRLYDKHKSFASNPLLLTMMLMTFEQIAEIPDKIHLFYEQAFLTLFSKHDSLKSLYKRKSYTGLPIDEFKSVLSAFSVRTYLDIKYHFNEELLYQYVGDALRITDARTDSKSFIKDLIESVCVLQRDGLGYTFTHRSFQEYFTAYFVDKFVSEKKAELIDRVAFANDRDDVVPMLLDMNQALVEREWVMPKLEQMIDKYKVYGDTDEDGLRMFSLMYDGIINTGSGPGYYLKDDKRSDMHFFMILGRLYREEVSAIYEVRNEKDKKRDEDMTNELVGIHEGLKFDDPTSLTTKQKDILIELGVHKDPFKKLNFAKNKLRNLTAKYESKDKDVMSMLIQN